jgi:hypothetical protein
LAELAQSIISIDYFPLANSRDLTLEKEVIGMILGVVIIIGVILITLQPENGGKETHF